MCAQYSRPISSAQWVVPLVAEPLRVLDPEIVVPNADSVQRLEFWLRLSNWMDDQGPRLGPSTLHALQEIAATPPRVMGLPHGEFWKIMGTLSSRGFTASSASRMVCDKHLGDQYTPDMGASDNFNRLLSDLRMTGPDRRVVVSTIESCWGEILGTANCSDCRESRISYLYQPIKSEDEAQSMAATWRFAYLDEPNVQLTQMSHLTSQMFPSLEFSDQAWKRADSLQGSSSDINAAVVRHLGVLNDHVRDIWTQQMTTDGRQSSLAALGVVSSPEGPRIHRWAKAMSDRTFTFSDEDVLCEWHTKLRPDVNRIYFAVDNGRVLIGAIVDHLLI